MSNNTPIESSKVLVLFIDHTVNIHQLQGDLQQALNNNILTIVVATSDVDSRFLILHLQIQIQINQLNQ